MGRGTELDYTSGAAPHSIETPPPSYNDKNQQRKKAGAALSERGERSYELHIPNLPQITPAPHSKNVNYSKQIYHWSLGKLHEWGHRNVTLFRGNPSNCVAAPQLKKPCSQNTKRFILNFNQYVIFWVMYMLTLIIKTKPSSTISFLYLLEAADKQKNKIVERGNCVHKLIRL